MILYQRCYTDNTTPIYTLNPILHLIWIRLSMILYVPRNVFLTKKKELTDFAVKYISTDTSLKQIYIYIYIYIYDYNNHFI